MRTEMTPGPQSERWGKSMGNDTFLLKELTVSFLIMSSG